MCLLVGGSLLEYIHQVSGVEESCAHKESCHVYLLFLPGGNHCAGEVWITHSKFQTEEDSRCPLHLFLRKETIISRGGDVQQEMSDQCCITRYQKNFTLAHSPHQGRTFLIFLQSLSSYKMN